MKKNNQGFSIIEWLLLLLILLILAAVGWYVWNAHNKTTDTLTNADAANSSVADFSKKKAAEKDPTADWVSYSNKEGKFSLKHPKTWVQASNPELCNPGLFLVGANTASVGKCATESFGQMSVASNAGDNSKDAELKDGYTKIVKTNVTVSNVSGVKMTAEASGQQQESEIGIVGLADGTKVTKYIFYTNGRTYTATYIAQSSYPDALSDFNLMVTKTLKFFS